MSGTLTCKPLEAKLLRDTELIGKMDPFVKFKLGKQEAKTKADDEAGLTPKWNDKITFRRTDEAILKVEIWDKDEITKNELIAETALNISLITAQPQLKQQFPVQFKGSNGGHITIAFEWVPDESMEDKDIKVQKEKLEIKIKELLAEIERMHNEISKLNGTIKQNEVKYTEQAAAKNAQISGLKQTLEDKDKHLQSSQSQHKTDVEKFTQQVNELNGQVTDQQKIIEEQKSNLVNLQNDLSNQIEINKQLSQTRQEELVQHEAAIQKLSLERDNLQQLSTDQSNEIGRLKTKLDKLQIDLTKCSDIITGAINESKY